LAGLNAAPVKLVNAANKDVLLIERFDRVAKGDKWDILCGNTDDHARNHAAFWDGKALTLTPAYDICPQGRTGNEASQAMLISGDNHLSQLKTCLETAHNFLLSGEEARDIFDNLTDAIEQHWEAVCKAAELNEVDKKPLWRRQFLNPYSVEQ
jgi:serine/threonine-protein kinase HipA